mgnify:CR=1 FL=1
MRKFNHGWQNRGRPGWFVGVYGLSSFDNAPAIIPTADDLVNHLPRFPADIAKPEIARLAVKAHPPGVAKTVGPDFWPCRAASDHRIKERVIGRDAVGPRRIGAIHVDSQDGRVNVADVLAIALRVRWVRRGSVSRGDVKVPIGPELQIAAVVPTAEECQQNRFACQVEAGRGRFGNIDTKPGNPGAMLWIHHAAFAFHGVADVTISILGELWMKRDGVEPIDLEPRWRSRLFRYVRGQIGEKLGYGLRIVPKAPDPAEFLADNQAIAAGQMRDVQRLSEANLRKRIGGAVRWWWFR